jgi:drug/metabolite transporter (DMT)-like permease
MICIASSGVFGSKLEMYPPIGIWSRSVVACLVLGAYCKFKGLDFKLEKGKSTLAIFISSVLMALHWVAYFFALVYSNVTISMLAIFTYPIITTLLEPFFFEVRLKLRTILIALVIMIGVYFLLPTMDLSSGDTLGFLYGLASALFYSFRNLMLKKEINKYNGSVLMWYQCTIAVIILLPCFFFSQPSMDILWHDLPYLIGLGVITSSIGHTTFLNSFEHFKISTVSIMSGMQPIYGILLAILFLHEIPSPRSILGGFIILTCVVVESMASIKND